MSSRSTTVPQFRPGDPSDLGDRRRDISRRGPRLAGAIEVSGVWNGRARDRKLLLLVLDLVGTFVFALSGATAGVKSQLDLFGVLVLSFVSGQFRGIARDVLIGATPPAAISDWRYLAVSLLAGVFTFWRPSARRPS